MSHLRTTPAGLSIALSSALLLALAGCGGGAPSREAARDQATTATCNRYAMCGQIGEGKAFQTMDACQINWQAKWDQAWQASSCEGKIDGSQLNVCLDAIMGTACNVADLLATLGKCSAANVCDATSADGG